MSKPLDSFNGLFKELYADALLEILEIPNMKKNEFKVGDRVIIIGDDAVSKIGWTGTIIILNSCPAAGLPKRHTIKFDDEFSSKCLYGAALDCKVEDIKLLEEKKPEVKEKIDTSWGF